MKTKFLVSALLIGSIGVRAQQVYSIDGSSIPAKPKSGHLKLGGDGVNGQRIAVNSDYVELNGKPWIPITGEFHYVRYPENHWDESLKKLKAGGINTVATYVFWNIHEQNEGKFDWNGHKDLRKFIQLCAKNGLYAIVRIGPFDHGEIRSGGLPDWLLAKPLTIRSNDRLYLGYVENLYKQIAGQIDGLYFKDGGPVIGIQIENEYQHSAAPWGLTYPEQPHDFTASERDLGHTQAGVGVANDINPYARLGNDHMKILKELAVRQGMIVPIYTATGWGNAAIIPDESIPVTAAYAYPFWTPKKDISPFFLYKDMHTSPDYAPVRYKTTDYPVFPAELGSGIMSVYTRRPIAVHKSFDAMINRCLGSGANGMGYYMYHGGLTPRANGQFFSDEAYGLPKVSYDFQAPIGEFGQVREGYHRLKLLHSFVNGFADIFAPMQAVLPENAGKLTPENLTDLRYALRSNGKSGFLFVNNFQDDTTMTFKKGLRFAINTTSGVVNIPASGTFDLAVDENVIFPYNFDLEGNSLLYATAQLYTKGGTADAPFYVFFAPEGIIPEFVFTGKPVIKAGPRSTVSKIGAGTRLVCSGDRAEFTISNSTKTVRILVLSKSTALKSTLVNWGGSQHLTISESTIIPAENAIGLVSRISPQFTVDVFPALTALEKVNVNATRTANGSFTTISWEVPEVSLTVQSTKISDKKIVITLPELTPSLSNIFLDIDYTGDTAMGFLDNELVIDEFYKGIVWDIGLRDFLATKKDRDMVFYFRPLYSNATYLRDLETKSIPVFGKERSALKINSIKFIPEYKTTLQFN